ncbi:MAG: hypothetical protein H7Y38_14675 [Armatimonadetes bacterium]|nr:hypothetical protein [Armatimonadota bacterium]
MTKISTIHGEKPAFFAARPGTAASYRARRNARPRPRIATGGNVFGASGLNAAAVVLQGLRKGWRRLFL